MGRTLSRSKLHLPAKLVQSDQPTISPKHDKWLDTKTSPVRGFGIIRILLVIKAGLARLTERDLRNVHGNIQIAIEDIWTARREREGDQTVLEIDTVGEKVINIEGDQTNHSNEISMAGVGSNIGNLQVAPPFVGRKLFLRKMMPFRTKHLSRQHLHPKSRSPTFRLRAN